MDVPSIVNGMESLLHELAAELDAVFIHLFGGFDLSGSDISTLRPRRWLIPTSTYGYGIWRPDDGVELVCMTDNTPRIFWDFCAEKLAIPRPRFEVSENSIALSLHTGASGSLAYRLEQFARKHKTNIRLCYCPIPGDFDLNEFLQYDLVEVSQLTSTGAHISDHYRKICDLHYVHRLFGRSGPTHQFIDYYESCRAWAIASGIYSPPLGLYLNIEAFFWLVFPLYTEHHQDVTIGDKEHISMSESLRAISKMHKSFSDIRSVTGRYTQKRTLTSAENTAIHEVLASATDEKTDGQLLVHACETFDHFRGRAKYHARLDASFWGSSAQTKSDFYSRTLPEFVQKAAHKVSIWPLPIGHDHGSQTYAVGFNNQQDLESIAVERTDDSVIELTIVDAKRLKCMHFSLIYRVLEFSGMLPPLDENEIAAQVDTGHYSTASGRRRTAKEVLSDLRYNPRHTGIDYEVGYRDRFEGIKWMALEEWGNKPVEDDEFIPLTRIQMFRRKADEQMIWERGVRPSSGIDAAEDIVTCSIAINN